ncbi:MAG TPA: hypothetical protein VN953_06840 [Gemmatimonadales bacterium]|nr:hypothetical protein [Gemmatimonadales bacterium]
MRLHYPLLLAALLALPVSLAYAQNPSGRGPGRRMQLVLKDITLTPEQQAKVDSIQTRYRTQMPSFTPGSSPDSATREKVRGLFRHELDDIRAVLTADQQKVFDKNLAEMRQGRRGGP